MGKLKISDQYMAAVVNKCSDAKPMMDVIIAQRAHIKMRNTENQRLNAQVEQLELDKRNMAHEMDKLRRENAQLRSTHA